MRDKRPILLIKFLLVEDPFRRVVPSGLED